ncbi:hypothetical protein ANCDUO_27259 [Ancylostoma duodenale]|uniref:Uncharacterized protein n=1 Tax=Ancylostoma duodenale TaxID=51022 RepID=A0A0C2BZE7_9BILA|nr:hypothetical protein ANCDUO_27259 [Ancylostoma duodenale]
MDSKTLGGIARTACNTACKAKNCRRGVCEKLTGRTRCECIFCGDGKSFPLDVLVESCWWSTPEERLRCNQFQPPKKCSLASVKKQTQ